MQLVLLNKPTISSSRHSIEWIVRTEYECNVWRNENDELGFVRRRSRRNRTEVFDEEDRYQSLASPCVRSNDPIALIERVVLSVLFLELKDRRQRGN